MQRNVQETWKTAPVAWESCWDMQKWVAEGWSLRYIFNYALALHGSYLNNKSAPLPEGPDVRPEVERFLRRLGYRLVLKELKHAANVKPGDKLAVSMKWQNMGSAPCYRPYRLAYRLSNDRGDVKVLVSKVTVNHWLPGSIDLFTAEFFRSPKDLPPGEVASVSDGVALPADLAPGQYTLSIAVVDQNQKPVLRLAIKGRADDGWYPLSKMTGEQVAGQRHRADGCGHRSRSVSGLSSASSCGRGRSMRPPSAATRAYRTNCEAA